MLCLDRGSVLVYSEVWTGPGYRTTKCQFNWIEVKQSPDGFNRQYLLEGHSYLSFTPSDSCFLAPTYFSPLSSVLFHISHHSVSPFLSCPRYSFLCDIPVGHIQGMKITSGDEVGEEGLCLAARCPVADDDPVAARV